MAAADALIQTRNIRHVTGIWKGLTMINFFTSTGATDLSLIRDEDVAALDDVRRAALDNFIAAVLTRGAAEERHHTARQRVNLAMSVEADAMAAHVAANPPPTQIEALRIAQAKYRETL
jgi:hypothetical protein